MAVVMEKRIVFEPRDILKVRLVCGICGGEFSPPTLRALTDSCPLCGKSWERDLSTSHQARDGYDKEVLRLLHLIDNLNSFSAGDYGNRRAEGKVPWKILLDLPGDLD